MAMPRSIMLVHAGLSEACNKTIPQISSSGVLCFLFVFGLLFCGLLPLVAMVRPAKRGGVRGRARKRGVGFCYLLTWCVAACRGSVGSLHIFACVCPSYHALLRGIDGLRSI